MSQKVYIAHTFKQLLPFLNAHHPVGASGHWRRHLGVHGGGGTLECRVIRRALDPGLRFTHLECVCVKC